jgi:hypothetical protein
VKFGRYASTCWALDWRQGFCGDVEYKLFLWNHDTAELLLRDAVAFVVGDDGDMLYLLMVNSTTGSEFYRISCGGGDADYYLCGYIFTDGDCRVMTGGLQKMTL